MTSPRIKEVNIELDESLPEDEVHIYQHGKLVGKIINIAQPIEQRGLEQRIAALEAQLAELNPPDCRPYHSVAIAKVESDVKSCCMQWDTCNERCIPLVAHWRRKCAELTKGEQTGCQSGKCTHASDCADNPRRCDCGAEPAPRKTLAQIVNYGFLTDKLSIEIARDVAEAIIERHISYSGLYKSPECIAEAIRAEFK